MAKAIPEDSHLLVRGLEFMSDGISELRTGEERNLRAGLLLLHAGIELIIKDRLQREHFSLVFQHPGRASKRAWRSGDFVSAGLEECLRRLEEIVGIPLGSDAKAKVAKTESRAQRRRRQLREFNSKRNQLVHFGLVDSADALRASANSALSFILDFVNRENEDEDLLAPDVRNLLKEIRAEVSEFEEFVRGHWDEIREEVDEAVVASRCDHCIQDAVLPAKTGQDECRCRFCGVAYEPKEAAMNYGEYILLVDAHEWDDHWPVQNCLVCDAFAMVIPKSSPTAAAGEVHYVCFSCGESIIQRLCSRCNEPFDPDPPGDTMEICSDCWSNLVEEDRL